MTIAIALAALDVEPTFLTPVSPDVSSIGSVGGLTSMLFVFVVAGILPAAFAFYLHHMSDRYRRRAAHAAAVEAGGAPVVTGVATIEGVVVFDEGEDAAVRIAIHQTGTVSTGKNGESHVWSETSREAMQVPFYVQQASGDLVRVEPDDSVLLVDTLDSGTRSSPTTRTRTAELALGERVFVTGEWAEGFNPRAASSTAFRGGTGPVFRSPKGERMLISARPLTERHATRAAFYARWRNVLVAFFIATHGLFFLKFDVMLFFGEKGWATFTGSREYESHSKSAIVQHYEIQVKLSDADAAPVFFETDPVTYGTLRTEAARSAQVSGAVPVLVPVRFLPSARARAWFTMTIGHEATLHAAQLLVYVLLLGLVVGLFRQGSRRAQPWFEKARLDEAGKGPLFPEVADE